MPLSPPVERTHSQTRAIECSCYRRADGMWDVEGHLTDVAGYAFDNAFRGTIHAGTPIHDMWVRLTLDENVEIREVEVKMDGVPYEICPAIEAAFQKLKGLRIGGGWNRKLRELLGGAQGCIHVVDLLRPVATVGFKTVNREKRAGGIGETPVDDRQPYHVNSCHALASDGPIVRDRWPQFYTGTE
ncbi:MAG: DUF2889 domain-containing protein [Alphaproteobacteria bacterium]|nr:DUF2889 domain-containing protein [Alphaproteobacteria bacterium]